MGARVPLDLPKDGSVFVVFRKASEGRVVGRGDGGSRKPAAAVELGGPWEVSFQAGRGAPERAVFDGLIDWSTHADSGIKHFSGTAIYRKEFEISADQAARKAILQLGEVVALAEVRLNGRTLGIVWTAPWQIGLTGTLREGTNALEIAVTNPWANRLIGDAALPPERRVTKSNLKLETGPRTLKAFQGYASEDPLQPSGLMGPVRLELY